MFMEFVHKIKYCCDKLDKIKKLQDQGLEKRARMSHE